VKDKIYWHGCAVYKEYSPMIVKDLNENGRGKY
jgi:hypothetical protein